MGTVDFVPHHLQYKQILRASLNNQYEEEEKNLLQSQKWHEAQKTFTIFP